MIHDVNIGIELASEHAGRSTRNVTVRNNLYFGASTTSPGSYPDANARYVDPLLVGPYADLHLSAGSPTIDAGLDLGHDAQNRPVSGAIDIDGSPRVLGNAIDIGAHEFADLTPVEVPAGVVGVPLRSVPNPFHGATTVEFTLSTSERVSLQIVDVRGRVVATLVRSTLMPGPHRASWDARDAAAGIYFARLHLGGRVRSVKLLHLG